MVVDSLLTSLAVSDLTPPPRSAAVRKVEFNVWFKNAKSGARIEYHRGHLVMDRVRGLSPFGERARRELIAVADLALALAEQGLLCLAQQRHGSGDYSYFAIKTNHPARGRRSA